MSSSALRPRFFGTVRGEAIKVSRQLSFWLMIVAGLLVSSWTGSLDVVKHIASGFWSDMERWALVQGMSMGIAILLAAAAAGLGRGLAFAIAASLAFYPADNFSVLMEALASRATKHD